MEETHLNSHQLKLYLDELTDLGLVEVSDTDGKRVYTASQKGIQWLRQYDVLVKLLR